MSRIFICYRRDDSGGYTGRLYEALAEEFGEDQVFRDLADIAGGDDFEEAIREHLATAAVALVIIGPQWATIEKEGRRRLEDPADHVAGEVRTSLESVPTVVPVLVGKAEMPARSALPEPLRPLCRRNALELSDSRWEYDVGRLVQLLRFHSRGGDSRRGTLVRSLAAGAAGWLLTVLLWATLFFNLLPGFAAAQRGFYGWLDQFAQVPFDEQQLALIVVDHVPESPPTAVRSQLRSQHGRLIRGLAAAGARAVAFDYYFEDATGGDAELAAAIREAGTRGTGVALGVRSAPRGRPDLASSLREVAGPRWGLVRHRIPRRVEGLFVRLELGRLLQDYRKLSPAELAPSLALRALMLHLGASKALFFPPRWLRLAGPDGEVLKEIEVDPLSLQSDVVAVNVLLPSPREFETHQLEYLTVLEKCPGGDLEDADFLQRKFGGRIVLVGSSTDRLDGFEQMGYQLQTQLLATLLLGGQVRFAGPGAAVLFLLLFGALGLLWWHRFAPRTRQLFYFRSRRQAWMRSTVVFLAGLAAAAVLAQLLTVVLFQSASLLLPALYCLAAFAAVYLLRTLAEVARPSGP